MIGTVIRYVGLAGYDRKTAPLGEAVGGGHREKLQAFIKGSFVLPGVLALDGSLILPTSSQAERAGWGRG